MNKVYLPWRGEFGTMIMHHVRFVHGDTADRKVVCCRKGDEALFPSATSFFYGWEQVEDKVKNTKLLKSEEQRVYLEKLTEELKKEYPDHEIVASPLKSLVRKDWDFTPKPIVKRQLKADIVVAPRFRQHGTHRNYKYWPETVDLLKEAGFSVAAIGMKSTSVETNADIKSWDYDNMDATLELLRNCELAVTTDSGMAHLAVLCGTPLHVIYDEPGREAGHPKWPWVLPHMKEYAKAFCEPICFGWKSPDLVVDFVKEYFDAKTRKLNAAKAGKLKKASK